MSKDQIDALETLRVIIEETGGYAYEEGVIALEAIRAMRDENVRLREALIRLVTCSDPFVSEIATNVLNGDYVEFRPDGKDFTVYGDDGNKTTYVRSEQEKGTDHE